MRYAVVHLGLALVSAAVCVGLVSCSLDTTGIGEDLGDAIFEFDTGSDTADTAIDTFDSVVPCEAGAGTGCNSPLGCFTGTVQCDGTCNAPSDPISAGSKCKTPKGC